jgi:hypothetical protein
VKSRKTRPACICLDTVQEYSEPIILFPGELEGLKIGEPEFLLFALPLKVDIERHH